MLMPPGVWQVVGAKVDDPSAALSDLSRARRIYEALASATMIQLQSFAGHTILNPDTEDDRGTSAHDHQGKVAFFGPWGESLGQFQASSPKDGVLGRYSLAIGPRDYVFILDPLGKKVQIATPTGESAGEVPLRAEAPDDVAVSSDAIVFVNDRLGTGEIQAYGIDSGFLDSVPARSTDLEVVGLTGAVGGLYDGVSAEVPGQRETPSSQRSTDLTRIWFGWSRWLHPLT